jgi:hypothetical protein
MGRSLRRVAPLLLAAAPAAWPQGAISFSAQVEPILTQRCVMCHLAGAAQAGLALYPEPWAALVGVTSTESLLKLVEPGSPEKSYLYAKLLGRQQEVGGSGAPMPFQQDPLEPGELATIRQWIEQGAASN